MSAWWAMASPSGASGDLGGVLLWVGILIGVVVIASIVLLALRRHFLAPPSSDPGHRGFLEELREARDRGEMTQEEFDLAKRSMVDAIAGRKATKTADAGEWAEAPMEGGRGDS